MHVSKGIKVLVTGGCGYIGSHTIVDLIQSGYDVVSLDNGLNASFDVLDGIEAITGVRVPNINTDLSEDEAVEAIRPYGPFGGIIHFAALKSVEESVYHPLRYFRNNVGGTLTTLAMMEAYNIPHLIFSFSCTVYGSPSKLPVTEDTPMGRAESPYGATKQTGEILYDQYFRKQREKTGISLRYFNPAGAHPSALIGESSTNKATNLVPVITETAMGLRDEVVVFGDDYPSRDGSCVRDYVHVMDLARAHTQALPPLLAHRQEQSYEVYNLGMGEGVTVLEAIHAFESSTGERVNYRIGPRRPGDVPMIYADNTRITQRLGWKPEMDIREIMRTAWAWEKARRR